MPDPDLQMRGMVPHHITGAIEGLVLRRLVEPAGHQPKGPMDDRTPRYGLRNKAAQLASNRREAKLLPMTVAKEPSTGESTK